MKAICVNWLDEEGFKESAHLPFQQIFLPIQIFIHFLVDYCAKNINI
jgi:hypothetical protein